mmetsp:Transcript_4099/g.4683  ORF Transcript_4099/g.4683 Transcript_4099/m.4683 type:complete len:270 (-) Transcript_4099:173-982(-)|eukprot:CAMPEP_0197853972 /NCGR_PEP_ID=MMETSP1438-20131217/23804_1 /TAXON_ID=1461541 /ORGANISM="Pterosperma sp., Strain CCMP1384" /LENGTH=269 /DNA_ID=CAMNT_0043468565 /DNA_START=114 /DNA_END=923 /DNA_ORIENTATION=+
MKIQGNAFIVTGGGAGLGLATSKRIIDMGGKVIMLDFNEENGLQAAKSLGPNAHFFQCDVKDTESIEKAIEGAKKLYPESIRGAVNCAGIGMALLTLDRRGNVHDKGVFEHVMGINTTGTFDVCRLTAAVMAKLEPVGDRKAAEGPVANGGGERGVLINVASLAGIEGQDGQVAYGASKAAVIGMTLPMARDLGRFGIRVNTIAPGTFETAMMGAVQDSVQNKLKKGTAYPPDFGNGAEFAHLVTSIIENTYLNGETIRIDGGTRMAKL